ncbi:UDP-N-acetylglucosamine:LPS N-acetylglucosamine transferase [Sporosarcina luteola]|nr:UDP-N-acetylglucosamine:LPS N-acetylglucosamine transferase [Sporosarcina luteola]
MKIVIFPFFRFPSGHSKVAEAIEERIVDMYPGATVKTVDFLSYCNGFLGKFVSSFYMKLINTTPDFYQKAYRFFIMKEQNGGKKHVRRFSPLYFERKMLSLIKEEEPDLLVFTHSFPSCIFGRLARKKKISGIPAINAYTDFFINDVWAKSEVMYHFVPHPGVRDTLMKTYGVSEGNIFVTGIPIKKIYKRRARQSVLPLRNIIVAGGNTGLFDIESIASLLTSFPDIQFTILCGRNIEYKRRLEHFGLPNASIKGYIESCEEMNLLYEQADAILTKPGGVTIAESLYKRVPIMICNHLPGQEQINMQHLTESGVAIAIDNRNKMSELLTDTALFQRMMAEMDAYVDRLKTDVEDALEQVVIRELKKRVVPYYKPLDWHAGLQGIKKMPRELQR